MTAPLKCIKQYKMLDPSFYKRLDATSFEVLSLLDPLVLIYHLNVRVKWHSSKHVQDLFLQFHNHHMKSFIAKTS